MRRIVLDEAVEAGERLSLAARLARLEPGEQLAPVVPGRRRRPR
jgi:hypothetical protein